MIKRRQFLLAATSYLMLYDKAAMGDSIPTSIAADALDWSDFKLKMSELAEAVVEGKAGQKTLTERGIEYLRQLNIANAEFSDALAGSYETGNRYWLWQRMIKDSNVNGGVLTIDRKEAVQLHDHPGATGMVRIISGEAEVWQFDELSIDRLKNEAGLVELKRYSRRILRKGDMAVLKPDMGNIHALRSISPVCAMLDFFIPPFKASRRSWYEPLAGDWRDREQILCRKIPQHDYKMV